MGDGSVELRPEGEGSGGIGKYGRLVIGDAAAAAEAEAIEVHHNKYGPLVIGQEAHDAAQAKIKAAQNARDNQVERSDKLQGRKGVNAPRTPAVPEADPGRTFPAELQNKKGVNAPRSLEEPHPDSGKVSELNATLGHLEEGEDAESVAYVSTKKVAEILEVNPAAFDQVLAAELQRVGGPRKSVLRSMLVREQKRELGARAPVVQAIEAHL